MDTMLPTYATGSPYDKPLPAQDVGMSHGKSRVDKLRDALREAAARFEDVAASIEKGGVGYVDAEFLRQSAIRCRDAGSDSAYRGQSSSLLPHSEGLR